MLQDETNHGTIGIAGDYFITSKLRDHKVLLTNVNYFKRKLLFHIKYLKK